MWRKKANNTNFGCLHDKRKQLKLSWQKEVSDSNKSLTSFCHVNTNYYLRMLPFVNFYNFTYVITIDYFCSYFRLSHTHVIRKYDNCQNFNKYIKNELI